MKRRILASVLVILFSLGQVAPNAIAQTATPSGMSLSQTEGLAVTPAVTEEALERVMQLQADSVLVTPTTTPVLLHENTSARLSKPTRVRGLAKRHFRLDEEIVFRIENMSQRGIKTIVKQKDGSVIRVKKNERTVDDVTLISLTPPRKIPPGEYVLSVTDEAGQETTMPFTWGVLAINPNKSVYLPGEAAVLGIAVLDEKGAMVCDAEVQLVVTDPSGKKETYSTDEGQIITNKECYIHDVTIKPDYEVSFPVVTEGEYKMMLGAKTKNGEYTISDSFHVDAKTPVSVERIMPTRIFPVKEYPVRIVVTAHEDFSGTIQESVPYDFQILPADFDTSYDSIRSVSEAEKAAVESMYGVVLGMPFSGERIITGGFGITDIDTSLLAKYREYGVSGHDGIDFDMPPGTEVLAAGDGEIVLAKEESDYGTTVVIQHDWGKSYYGQLGEYTVENGQKVEKGDVIGRSGSTGLTTGSHLHFGIKPASFDTLNGFFGKIDPLAYLPIATEEQKNRAVITPVDTKTIEWDVDMKKGETIILSYLFDAPNISPQLFSAGPLRMTTHTGADFFSEHRTWSIASDYVEIVRPDGDVTDGTDFANCVTNGNGSCDFGVVDEITEITGDYVGTGTSGNDGDTERFSMASVAGSSNPVTQVDVSFQANSQGGCSSACDDLSVNISIDGILQTAQTRTMTATDTLYSHTFTGTWTGDNDLEIVFTRNVLGSGNPNNRDDDVRIYQAYATVTYTENPAMNQLMRHGKWFNSVGSKRAFLF